MTDINTSQKFVLEINQQMIRNGSENNRFLEEFNRLKGIGDKETKKILNYDAFKV